MKFICSYCQRICTTQDRSTVVRCPYCSVLNNIGTTDIIDHKLPVQKTTPISSPKTYKENNSLIGALITLVFLSVFLITCHGICNSSNTQLEANEKAIGNVDAVAKSEQTQSLPEALRPVKYIIINQENGVFDVVISGKVTKEKIRWVIKDICQKAGDYTISVGIWKSKKYYKSTNGNGTMLALYLPSQNMDETYVYTLSYSDETFDNRSASQF